MAPPQGQPHPGRQLAFLGAIFVVLYLLVFFGAGAAGSIANRLHPNLGLDLIGGTQVTYTAQVQGGGVRSGVGHGRGGERRALLCSFPTR